MKPIFLGLHSTMHDHAGPTGKIAIYDVDHSMTAISVSFMNERFISELVMRAYLIVR